MKAPGIQTPGAFNIERPNNHEVSSIPIRVNRKAFIMKRTRSPISSEVLVHGLEQHQRECNSGLNLLECCCGAGSFIVQCDVCGETLAANGNPAMPCECIAWFLQ